MAIFFRCLRRDSQTWRRAMAVDMANKSHAIPSVPRVAWWYIDDIEDVLLWTVVSVGLSTFCSALVIVSCGGGLIVQGS